MAYSIKIDHNPMKIHEITKPDAEKEAVLTPCLLDDGKVHDSVLIFPGGGYNHVSLQKEGSDIARAFNERGLNAFYLDYRVRPSTGVDILSDAVRAVQFIRYHAGDFWNIGSKLALMGFSAGGHLALMETEHGQKVSTGSDNVSRESSQPDVLILCYPVVTFCDPYAHKGSRMNFLGAGMDQDVKQIDKYSAERHVTPDFPPVFLWHCEGDESVPIQNSLMLRNALERSGVDHKLIVYPNGAHGLGLAKDDDKISGWFDQCADWLLRQGFI